MQRLINVKQLFVGLLAVLVLGGCTTNTVQSRKQKRYAAYQSFPSDIKTAVDQGRITAGMNMDAVYIAWGNPDQVVTGGNQAGEAITWLYHGSYLGETSIWGDRHVNYAYYSGGYVRAQVVFVNGVVKEWQTFPSPVY
ncbi:MAG TPA: hypothetical protein VG754_10590 [Verrucomicrobiae bacterium]|nr:hypothetical protein [Verrucomicrobiae bacterium]